MLSRLEGTEPQELGSGVQSMPGHGITLVVVIASHTGRPFQKVGFGRMRGC